MNAFFILFLMISLEIKIRNMHNVYKIKLDCLYIIYHYYYLYLFFSIWIECLYQIFIFCWALSIMDAKTVNLFISISFKKNWLTDGPWFCWEGSIHCRMGCCCVIVHGVARFLHTEVVNCWWFGHSIAHSCWSWGTALFLLYWLLL